LVRELARQLGLTSTLAQQAGDVIVKLYKPLRDKDAELVDINPLVISGDTILAADGKITIDDDALFRVSDSVPRTEERTELEQKVAALGISYVPCIPENP
jgi:succinyl-CoA synthetase beta subunit